MLADGRVMLDKPVSSPPMNQDEWRLRCELANFYHLVDYLGWTELIFNHISARLPGPAHHYLVNPFGLNYREVTPQNLLKVSVEGAIDRARPNTRPIRPVSRCMASFTKTAPTWAAWPIPIPRRSRRSR